MKAILMPVLAAVALVACATTRMSDADRLALYQAHAGEPVKQIRNRGAIGWDRVDGSHVLLQMRPAEWWLLGLSGNCLDWSNGSPVIAISSPTDWVVSKLDRLSLGNSAVTCRIEEIRSVDIKGVRAERDAMAAQASSGT